MEIKKTTKGNKNLDLIGEKFGKLKVIELTNLRKDKSKVWKCFCTCGNTHLVNTKHLMRGAVKSCGCLIKNKRRGQKFQGEDLTNKIFGRLKVIKFLYSDKFQHRVWECICSCGKIKNIDTGSLNSGHTKSCGCLNLSKTGNLAYNYTGYKDISGKKWNSIKNNAKVRGLEFEITKEFVSDMIENQNYLCKLINIVISFKLNTASVDRIDNNIGYLENNIQIVHKDINFLRGKFSIDYFKKLCKAVSKTKN